MENFGGIVARWSGFYSVLSQVSATFAGLLFVSLSLRYEQLNQDGFASVKRLAQHTFKAFLFLVIFALIFLIPEADVYGTSIPLLLFGLYALVKTIKTLMMDSRPAGPGDVRVDGARKIYLLSILTYGMFVVVSVLLLVGSTKALYLVVGLVIWNLALVTSSSWDLLVELKSKKEM